MKAGNFFLSALSLAANLYTTKAADCGGYGVGSDSIGACTDRTGNYKDREIFCTTLVGQGNWKRTCQNGRNSGKCHFEYQGPGMPQQMCWDAYENIINQCFNHQNGGGYHYGTWSLNGHWFAIDRRMLAVILLYLSGTSLAQNAAGDRQYYNSTRTLSYKFKGQSKPWYITTAVTDVRPQNGERSRLEISVFVSVPQGYATSRDGRDIRFCGQEMARVWKTSDNPTDAEHSCEGVISAKCVKEYEDAYLPVPARGQKCPDFNPVGYNVSKECRHQNFAGFIRNFTSTRCELEDLPYFDLPANYETCSLGWQGFDGDSDPDDFDRYDRTVQQTLPVLMSVANGKDNTSESKLLCITPNQVVPGSRTPESKLGDDDSGNTASRVGGLGAVFLGVGIVMIFRLLPSDFTDEVDKRAIFFNASGTLSIEFKGAKDAWYISTAITDERDQKRTFDGAHSRQWIKGFISVPRYLVAEKSVGVCSFMFQGLNSSSENPDDADESCKGVISDACIEELENSTLPIRTSGNCPTSSAFILSDECKKHLTLYQTVQARNISTENCTLSNIPNLDVPVDYWTYGGSVSSGETGSDEYDDFDSYDMRVQQTIPIFTVVSGGGISDRKLVCITPNKIVSGSRKPEMKLEGTEEDGDEESESEEGDENKASRVGGWGAVFLSTVVMIFTLL
ncbi:hypothetical protein FPANT_545 [Fusarium pseudoanthophilum]|uniref:Uncharacterized protein n=1 Tax=Fusarium pseudoanthophilum TaxID=48495 RepID=A0A8H5V4V6_9HYPO|nr:hypothetical protein FPANT_545 [Fusarium pseudoanthophilum]